MPSPTVRELLELLLAVPLEELEAYAKDSGVSLQDAAVNLNLGSRSEILRSLARAWRMEPAEIEELKGPHPFELVSPEVWRRNRAMPLVVDGSTLRIALSQPDALAVDALARRTGLTVESRLALPSEIDSWLESRPWDNEPGCGTPDGYSMNWTWLQDVIKRAAKAEAEWVRLEQRPTRILAEYRSREEAPSGYGFDKLLERLNSSPTFHIAVAGRIRRFAIATEKEAGSAVLKLRPADPAPKDWTDRRLAELSALARKPEPDSEPSNMVGWLAMLIDFALDAGIARLRVDDGEQVSVVARMDGETLVALLEVPRERGSLVTLFKVCSHMDLAERTRAQQGSLRHERQGKSLHFPAETIVDVAREAYLVRLDSGRVAE